jgi:hypothetical protein
MVKQRLFKLAVTQTRKMCACLLHSKINTMLTEDRRIQIIPFLTRHVLKIPGHLKLLDDILAQFDKT